MIHSGASLVENSAILLSMALLSLLICYFSFAKVKNTKIIPSLFFLLILLSAASWVGGPVIYMLRWKGAFNHDFKVFPYFAGILNLLTSTVILGLIPLLFNFLMRNSTATLRQEKSGRHDFLATNSSWLILRLATFSFVIASILSGFTLAEVYFPSSNMHETLSQKLGSVVLIIVPLVFGVWFGVKVLNKLNLVAYKWKLSSDSSQKS